MKKFFFSLIFLNYQIFSNYVGDVTRLKNISDTYVIGLGIVNGLNGKGEDPYDLFFNSTIQELTAKLGLTISSADLENKNVSIVSLTARVPYYAKVGDKVDVEVSVIGQTSDLNGAILLMSKLNDSSQNISITAQGKISGKTSAIISNGGIVDKINNSGSSNVNSVGFLLEEPNITMAKRLKFSIESELKLEGYVNIIDERTIEVAVPKEYKNDVMGFIAKIKSVDVRNDYKSQIVINKNKQIIVSGESIKVGSVIVTIGDVKIDVKPTGQTYSDATVGEIFYSLLKLGVSIDDVIGVIESLSKSDALDGYLVVI